jgi:hypothetical protein
MAPEQARGEPLDARADVYAVGLVLREALTGQRGRAGTDRDSTLAAARTGALEPWPEGITTPLREIVDRATAPAAGDRYADAGAMLEALDHFIVGERAANKGDGPARQLAGWLAAIWQDEREESAIEDAIEGAHLVSFLDDGALDVIGTGTQRSMAATAAEEAPPDAAPAPEPPAPEASAAAPAPAKKKRAWLAPATLALPAIAAIVGVVLASTSTPTNPSEPAPPVVVTPPVEVKRRRRWRSKRRSRTSSPSTRSRKPRSRRSSLSRRSRSRSRRRSRSVPPPGRRARQRWPRRRRSTPS